MFLRDGYAIEEGVLSASECDALIEQLADEERSRAGARHLMANPDVAALAKDERLITLARKALRGHALPFRATLFEKSMESNWLIPWHQDTALPLEDVFQEYGWGPWSEKQGVHYAHAPAWALARVVALRVHLDESFTDNGPLCVIARSHRKGVLSDEQVSAVVASKQPMECPVARGGVLVMSPMILHASSKAQINQPRRVLHIEYADSLNLAPGIRLAVV